MKRVTLSIDPDVLQHARQLAYDKNISLSVLVEGLLRSAEGNPEDFVTAWAGRFSLMPNRPGDLRRQRLNARYNLPDQ